MYNFCPFVVLLLSNPKRSNAPSYFGLSLLPTFFCRCSVPVGIWAFFFVPDGLDAVSISCSYMKSRSVAQRPPSLSATSSMQMMLVLVRKRCPLVRLMPVVSALVELSLPYFWVLAYTSPTLLVSWSNHLRVANCIPLASSYSLPKPSMLMISEITMWL